MMARRPAHRRHAAKIAFVFLLIGAFVATTESRALMQSGAEYVGEQARGTPSGAEGSSGSGSGGGNPLEAIGNIVGAGFKAIGSLFGGNSGGGSSPPSGNDGGKMVPEAGMASAQQNGTAAGVAPITQAINSTLAGMGQAITTAFSSILPGLNHTQSGNTTGKPNPAGGFFGINLGGNSSAAASPAESAARVALTGAAGAATALLLMA